MPQHFEQRQLPYSQEQLFALVADIERYPEFLPWCLGARICEHKRNELTADLVVGYKSFHEKFTSLVTLKPSTLISIKYGGGPLKHLNNEWRFMPGDTSHSCNLAFYVDFSMKSAFFGRIMDLFFDQAFRKMVGAFEKRAADLYGHEI